MSRFPIVAIFLIKPFRTPEIGAGHDHGLVEKVIELFSERLV